MWSTIKFGGNQYHSEAVDYFASLRERQAELDRRNAAVNYHKLKKGEQQ
jgi:hypothetical protein